ncbi:MAG: glycosyltransferase [Candidatus Jordarchaeales archaeon]|nr:glycosyltransferase [Candidatus Jordarchaeia archaeon]
MTSKVTVVVPTYNRVNHVVECLESVFRQKPDWCSVLVIDNLSDDGTGELLRERYGWRGDFRLVSPSRRISIAEARNYGLREAEGDVVVFIDDDCVACDGWLENLVSPLRLDESIGCVGGRIRPIFLGQPPRWLRRDVYGLLGLTDWGDSAKDIFFPIGGNMALRREVAMKVGGFQEKLGPRGVKLFGEEISISERLRKAGYRVVYEPRAVVLHKLWGERLSLRSVAERAYMISMGDYFLFGRSIGRIAVNLGILFGSALGYTFYHQKNLICHFFYALGYLAPALAGRDPVSILDQLLSALSRLVGE